MVIIGIDPGLSDTGWGIIKYKDRKFTYIAHGCIKTKANDSLPDRLLQIYNVVASLIDEYKADKMAIEALYFNKNISSAIPVSHARGVVLLAFAQKNIECFSYTPSTIKQAVAGSGSATKEAVQQMVKVLLALKEIPKPNHAADALAVAMCLANGGTAVKMA